MAINCSSCLRPHFRVKFRTQLGGRHSQGGILFASHLPQQQSHLISQINTHLKPMYLTQNQQFSRSQYYQLLELTTFRFNFELSHVRPMSHHHVFIYTVINSIQINNMYKIIIHNLRSLQMKDECEAEFKQKKRVRQSQKYYRYVEKNPLSNLSGIFKRHSISYSALFSLIPRIDNKHLFNIKENSFVKIVGLLAGFVGINQQHVIIQRSPRKKELINYLQTNIMAKDEKNIGKFSLLNSALTWMSTLVVYPLNKINVRLQVSSTPQSGGWGTLRELITKEGFRGCYKGVSMTTFGMVPTFLITYLYEKLNHTWKNNQTLRSSSLYGVSPMINVFLAGVPTYLLSTPTSMMMTLIHSEKLSAKQAVARLRTQHFKAYLDIYRSSILTMSIFFCVRQQLFEQSHIFRNRFSLSENQSIFATALVSSFLANLVYQPIETLQARLVVENRTGFFNVISNLRKQKGFYKTLFKGFCTKTTSTGIFNCVYFPVYSKLKGEFSLCAY